MQAIILAGGFGTRLTSVVPHMPKPLAPVGGMPFLFWLLQYAQAQGVTEATLCLHHHATLIQSTLGTRFGAMQLQYSIEKEPLGTGGALKQALSYMGGTGPVLAMNGDSMVGINYREMLALHQRSETPLTLAAKMMPDCSRYSVLTRRDERVVAYQRIGGAHAGLASLGFYVLERECFARYNLPMAFSLESDFLAPYARKVKPAIFDSKAYFIDIGIPEDYARAQAEIPAWLKLNQAA